MDFSIPDSALAAIVPVPEGAPKKQNRGPDERMFKIKLTAENDFTYKAKLRLLYRPGSPAAIVKVMRHYFSNPTGVIGPDGKPKMWTTSTLCPKSIGEKCPICDNAWNYSDLFAKTGDKRFEKLKKDRLAKTSYLTNVYIINDETVPSNNGKVKAWFMSNGVHKKIQNVMFPTEVTIDDDEFAGDVLQKVVPFHPKEGVNMMLISNYDDRHWQSYENTKFATKIAPLASSDEAIQGILSQCYDLDEWAGKSKFKTFDELSVMLRTHDERTGLSDTDGNISVIGTATDGPALDIPSSHKKDSHVAAGDSDAFFASDSISDDEFSMPATAPVASAAIPSNSVDITGDDDDLPF